MAFRTILTVTTPQLGDTDINLAARLADEVSAHLTVLVSQPAAPPPLGEGAAMVDEAWLLERQEEAQDLTARTDHVTRLLAARPDSGAAIADYVETADQAESIGRCARYADLTLAGPEAMASKVGRAIVDGTLFFSGRPMLVVPKTAIPTLRPQRVVVAWDARVEAARAVREALDLIVGADEVRIVLVDPAEGERSHGAEPGADIAAYLARHGAQVFVDRLPSGGLDVAAVLRLYSTDFGADLLVMGGYGHSRLRERIFGGVTRSILANPPTPVLMAR